MAAESTESAALSVTLHPLVIINMSDHFTRNRCNSAEGGTSTRVYGILIGVQNGRQIEIANSFEVKVVPDGACARLVLLCASARITDFLVSPWPLSLFFCACCRSKQQQHHHPAPPVL